MFAVPVDQLSDRLDERDRLEAVPAGVGEELGQLLNRGNVADFVADETYRGSRRLFGFWLATTFPTSTTSWNSIVVRKPRSWWSLRR